MVLSRLWNELYASELDRFRRELFALNEQTAVSGVLLSETEVNQLLAARNETLAGCGRVELGIEAGKQLIESFASSPYTHRSNYFQLLLELQELFYYLKNETEDTVSDRELIDLMRDCFDAECGGAVELLRSRMEEYASAMRRELALNAWYDKGDEQDE